MAYRRKKGIFGLFRKKRRSYRFDGFGRGFFDWDWQLNSETKKGIAVIVLFGLAALSLLGLFDLYGNTKFGQGIILVLGWLFGDLKWIFPLLAILFGYFLLRDERYQVSVVNYFGGLLFLLGFTALWHLRFDLEEMVGAAGQGLGGGYFGLVFGYSFFRLMGFWGTLTISLSFFLIGLLLIFETSIYGLFWPVKFFRAAVVKIKDAFLFFRDLNLSSRRLEEGDSYEEEVDQESPEEEEEEKVEAGPEFSQSQIADRQEKSSESEKENQGILQPKKFGRKIELPLALLTARSGKPTSGDIKANQQIIKKTLANFGIEVEMGGVNVGPTVTQYTFRPAEGVKLSRIVGLNNNLALALAAPSIRIEAPIPGRSLVGVEIPNKLAARVTMNELLGAREFKNRSSNLILALGRDVSGSPYFSQLEKLPHLLIAGATGSGKSVCINSIITSLLYQNSPDELKFILVDPKRVELPIYNNIPYLLTPVITDSKKTINALKWLISEMERRFNLLSQKGKRNIAAYNKSNSENLPYIVFVVDELADLMSAAGPDIEAGIVRLAQMARAVGIHLILATQRPSVEVITGLIKANIPARIAFAVASAIDSRTVLDTAGAERLVGNGDMLYLSPEISRPKRLQGVYLSDQEIKNIVQHIKAQGQADYLEAVVEKSSAGQSGVGFDSDNQGDSLLGEAKEVIRQSGKASASLLQRRLKIGYARAARILDLLEEQGIIGPADGAKPREVFLDKLTGTGALEFAAREHGLSGELAPAGNFQEESSADSGKEEEAEESNREEFSENSEVEEKTENFPESLEEESSEEDDSQSADFSKEESSVEKPEILETKPRPNSEPAESDSVESSEKEEFNEEEWT